MIPRTLGRSPRILAGFLAAFAATEPLQAARCEIFPESVSFGAYDPSESGDLDGVGNISINCDEEVSFTISLSAGTGGSYSSRRMTSGVDQMAYNLFTSTKRIIVWGDGSERSDVVSGRFQTAEIPVYGLIPARQNIPAGSYGDTIVVTISY